MNVKELIKVELKKMTPKEKMAFFIAFGAHQGRGQLDKGGLLYINHPLTLCSRLDSEDARIVALLHDTVEDTSLTLEQLSMFFDKNIIDALALLTHDPKVPYEKYIDAIKENPLATKVKIEDLKHNMDKTRITKDKEHILNKIENVYKPSLAKLLK